MQRPKGFEAFRALKRNQSPRSKPPSANFLLPCPTHGPRACPARSESHKKSMPCSAPKILKTLQRVESPKTIGTCTMFPCFAKAKQFFGRFCNHPFNRICGFKRNLFSLTFILQLLQGKNQTNFDTIFKILIKILKLCRLNIFKGAKAARVSAPASGGKPRGRPSEPTSNASAFAPTPYKKTRKGVFFYCTGSIKTVKELSSAKLWRKLLIVVRISSIPSYPSSPIETVQGSISMLFIDK